MNILGAIILIIGIYMFFTNSYTSVNGSFLFKIFLKYIPILMSIFIILYGLYVLNIININI